MSIKDSIINECVNILKRDDIKKELKLAYIKVSELLLIPFSSIGVFFKEFIFANVAAEPTKLPATVNGCFLAAPLTAPATPTIGAKYKSLVANGLLALKSVHTLDAFGICQSVSLNDLMKSTP